MHITWDLVSCLTNTSKDTNVIYLMKIDYLSMTFCNITYDQIVLCSLDCHNNEFNDVYHNTTLEIIQDRIL